MKIILVLTFVFSLSSAIGQIKEVTISEFEKIISTSDDSTVVVNFWATWCKPCIKELSYFSIAADSLKDSKVRFVFASLDFSDSKARVEQVAKKQDLKGDLILLSGDPNEWINKIDPAWQGNIPFTVVYSNGLRESTDKPFHSVNELVDFIN